MYQIRALLSAIALLFCANAFAGGFVEGPVDDGSGFYLGLQAGYVDTNWDNIDQNAFGHFEFFVDCDDDYGARVFLGYATNKYISSELGWTYLGCADISRDASNLAHPRKITTIEMYAFDNSYRLSVPLTCNFGVLARFGVSYLISCDSLNWRTIGFLPIDQDPDKRTSSKFAVTYGVGVYYNVIPFTRVEIGWSNYRGQTELGDSYQPSPDFFYLGVTYQISHFFGGGRSCCP